MKLYIVMDDYDHTEIQDVYGIFVDKEDAETASKKSYGLYPIILEMDLNTIYRSGMINGDDEGLKLSN